MPRIEDENEEQDEIQEEHYSSVFTSSPQGESESSTQWMVTFADLLSLILTFFVLLYSMSAVEQPKWKELVHALHKYFTTGRDVEFNQPLSELSITTSRKKLADFSPDYLESILIRELERIESIEDYLTILKKDDRIIIRVKGDDMFTGDGIQPSKKAIEIMSLLSDVAQSLENQFEVYNYISANYVTSETYPSYWEYGLARSIKASKIFADRGYLHPVLVYGRPLSVLSGSGEEDTIDTTYDVMDIVIRDFRAGG